MAIQSGIFNGEHFPAVFKCWFCFLDETFRDYSLHSVCLGSTADFLRDLLVIDWFMPGEPSRFYGLGFVICFVLCFRTHWLIVSTRLVLPSVICSLVWGPFPDDGWFILMIGVAWGVTCTPGRDRIIEARWTREDSSLYRFSLVLSGSDLLSERVALPLDDFGSSSCVVRFVSFLGLRACVFSRPSGLWAMQTHSVSLLSLT